MNNGKKNLPDGLVGIDANGRVIPLKINTLTNFIIAGTTNTMTFTSVLTAPRIFTLPDANSNAVVPSTAPTNQFATGINSSGVIQYAQVNFSNLSGIASIAQGGTGQTTGTAARNALLPSQTGNAGRTLGTSGANVFWVDTVTAVTVAPGNGFAGTVATPFTTPAITISTTVIGLLKGDGASVSAATATDIPTTNVLSSVTNTMTSVVNSVSSNTPIVNSNSLALTTTSLTSNVNGVAAPSVQVSPSPESPTSSITFTTLTEVLLLVAPSINPIGTYNLRLVSSSSELNVIFTFSGNPSTSYKQSEITILQVNDSAGIINETNIQNFLLFRGYLRNITPNSYFAVTISMPYTVFYTNPISMTVYQYAGSYLNENFTITNMITTGIENLVSLAPADLIFNITTAYVPTTVFSPQGYLYASANTGGTISQFSINNLTGALAALAPATVTTPAVPYAVATTKLRNFLYATNQTTNAIYQYSINSTTGALTALSPISVVGAAAPTGIAIDPTDRFVYACGFNAPGTISQFTITKATGQLVAIAGAVNALAGMQDLAVHPSGKFLYAINTASNNIFQYSINSTTGALTALSPLNIATGTSPFNIVIHPSGLFAYVLNNATATISQYSINTTTGQLTALSPATFAVGGNPFGLCISRNGRFIYHASATAGNVSQSTINLTTGLIGTPTTTINVPTARHCVIDFSGNFLFSSNTGANQTRAFSINQTTGALTAVAPNLTLGANITSLATI
jgi:6-phosphogluconolactonase (cycloisomerase 2 family)